MSPDHWDEIERDIAYAEQLANLDETLANGPLDCAGLRRMLDRVLADLAGARISQQDLQDLGKRVDAQIARVQNLVGLNATLAEAAAHTILAPFELARNLLTGESTSQQVQSWKDVLRSLKLDRRLVDAYLARNQKLIEHLSELKGRLEGLHKAQCNDSGTTTPPAPAKTFGVGVDTSYTHPGGNTSTLCVRVTTSPPRPGGVRVKVTGPGVVGPADQTKTLDESGQIVVDVTINAYGTYSVTATVSAGDETETATATQEVKKAQATCPPP